MSASSSNREPAGDAGGSLHLRVADPFTADGFGAIHIPLDFCELDFCELEDLCGFALSLSPIFAPEPIVLPAFFFPDTKSLANQEI
jgi:hypothetical protein